MTLTLVGTEKRKITVNLDQVMYIHSHRKNEVDFSTLVFVAENKISVVESVDEILKGGGAQQGGI